MGYYERRRRTARPRHGTKAREDRYAGGHANPGRAEDRQAPSPFSPGSLDAVVFLLTRCTLCAAEMHVKGVSRGAGRKVLAESP